ncbi:hypothetical protein MK851_12475 [Tenacibaculum sp. 1B UA]|uniref:hypothetical protein n=1 Tax=Tenacibaculum sp. 1B UA TaxID=2922252 RepID=UPI002A23E36A|nr:hypothetical protein [Tenacibaculum sp. 1B UA]MDX8554433.1 hypothetical protein [Tenacibaculum sp. 1B UA]
MITISLVKLAEKLPNFPTLSLVEEYKYNTSPKGRKEMEDMFREIKNLLPNKNAQDFTSNNVAFETPEPTAIYYNHDVVFDTLDLDEISENALVINGNLNVNSLLINAEIDINTTLVVLGSIRAKNCICSGSEIYVTNDIHVTENFIAYYNHGSISTKNLYTNLLLTDDYRGFQIPNYKAHKNCHWQDKNTLPYTKVLQPELIEHMIDHEGNVQHWLNFEKICNYLEADKDILR